MDRLGLMLSFRRVAELGSFSAAARDLGLSNAVISKHVAVLEGYLGARLINRTTRRHASGHRATCARPAISSTSPWMVRGLSS